MELIILNEKYGWLYVELVLDWARVRELLRVWD